jgi:2-methylisocitrate lyase-like PEP mutase family enzyme
VDVPLTADIERGYAEDPQVVAENVRRVLEAGAVGINIEDSTAVGGPLYPTDFQCERLRTIRKMAAREDIPLVINARTDVFYGGIDGSTEEKVRETISRGKAYLEAGADCLYPILVGDLEVLKQIQAETGGPINVYASASTAPMRELEAAGISRLSLGPGLLKASLTEMRRVAQGLLEYGPYSLFTEGVMSTPEVRQYISGDRMSD